MTEFNLNGFIKFPTKSQKKFKSIKWKVKGGEYISEGETPDAPDIPDNIDCLCFISTGESTIGLTNYQNNAPVLYYSKDKKKWKTWKYGTITLADGESVYFCGENPNGFSSSNLKYSKFTMTGSIAASGNIQTLLSPAGDRMDVPSACYQSMFNGCTALTVAPNLPATTLASSCYRNMFKGCSALTSAPEFPATTLADSCYSYMFYSCTSLTTAPELPATNLAENCYEHMFANCSNLTTAPELPATTLANKCYSYMFSSCSNLTTAPSELPATTLADYCYENMFANCKNLTTAPSELPATTLANNCYRYMFSRCSNLTTAFTLPATTIASGCYYFMFQECSNLQYVTTYITTWNVYYTAGWLKNAGTSATNPTVYCPADSTIPEDDNSGIPTGWARADLPTS